MRAADITNMRGGRFMSVEDIIFLMRKDKVGSTVISVMFVKLTLSCSYTAVSTKGSHKCKSTCGNVDWHYG